MAWHFAGWFVLWHALAVIAPIVAGPMPVAVAPHNCPAPYSINGVGSDLKTYQRTFDRCASD